MKVVVIGAGASGLMVASKLANEKTSVILLEHSKQPGQKLLITGKGRCNITCDCETSELMQNIPKNGRFLYSAFSKFSPYDTMSFFEDLGVSLKTERGKRVFPESDDAREVVFALVDFCKEHEVEFVKASAKQIIYENDRVKSVRTDKMDIDCDFVVVATGGVSYPKTGSTGDGYVFAKEAGHSVTKISGSLVPLQTLESWPKRAQGLSLKNVTLSILKNDKQIFSQQGEMLFTHFGISGPLVLSASSVIENTKTNHYKASIDLKPALSKEKLSLRILREIKESPNRDMSNFLRVLVPSKLVTTVCNLAKMPLSLKANQMTKQNRVDLIDTLKELSLTIEEKRPIEEAIITSGGVNVKEINPKTMESLKKEGLYFVGEVLDVDAYTGGFNLQIAWSTAVAAAESIADKLQGLHG